MSFKFIDEAKNICSNMDSLFLNALGNVFCNDKTGKCLSANENELHFFNLTDFDDLIGKDTRELADPEQAKIYLENDLAVMHSGRGMVLIEPNHKGAMIEQYICYKAPLSTTQGKNIGIFGIGYSITEMVSSNKAIQERILHEILLLAGPSVESIFKKIILDAKQTQLGLSKRQIQCLELLAKGMTYKQIGRLLSISIRTVEHYIDAIKIKWNCDCRHTLIEKFLNN